MNYLSGTAAHLGNRWLGALGIYRHRVFVQRLGWDLPEATEDREWDRFDRDDTVHVMSLDGKGRLTGCARLLPTTQPYLLSEVFPQLLDGGPAPRCVEVWELSRFAACDLGSSTGGEHSLGSVQALELLRASMRTAYRCGARGLVSVSPIAIQRILRHGRFEFSRLGQTHQIGGHSLFACGLPMHSALQHTPILF